MMQWIKAYDCPINSISLINADLPDPKKNENKTMNLIATAGEDHLIHLWDLRYGTKVGTFGSGHEWNLYTYDPLNRKKKEKFSDVSQQNHIIKHISEKQDISKIEKANQDRLTDIEKKLKELMSSKSALENELENEEEIVKSTL